MVTECNKTLSPYQPPDTAHSPTALSQKRTC